MENWISYKVHVSQNTVLPLTFFQPFKDVKAILCIWAMQAVIGWLLLEAVAGKKTTRVSLYIYILGVSIPKRGCKCKFTSRNVKHRVWWVLTYVYTHITTTTINIENVTLSPPNPLILLWGRFRWSVLSHYKLCFPFLEFHISESKYGLFVVSLFYSAYFLNLSIL